MKDGSQLPHDIEKLVARVQQPDLALDKEINNLWTK